MGVAVHPKVLSPGAWNTVRKLVNGGYADGWMLAGGTALALQLGHRFSEDLDFFRGQPFDGARLAERLAGAGPVRIQSRGDNTLHVLLNKLRVSYLQAQVPFMFPGAAYRGMTIADPRDIAVMKIVAAGGRGSRKDFIDLYFLMESGCSLENILELLKASHSRVEHNAYHLLKSLVYFDDAESEPMPRMIRKVQWSHVKKSITDAVRRLSIE